MYARMFSWVSSLSLPLSLPLTRVSTAHLIAPAVVQKRELHREENGQNRLQKPGHDARVVEILEISVHDLVWVWVWMWMETALRGIDPPEQDLDVPDYSTELSLSAPSS